MAVHRRALPAISDAPGRSVALLADGELEQGDHAFTFDAHALPPGITSRNSMQVPREESHSDS